MLVKGGKGQAGDVYCSDSFEINIAGAVDPKIATVGSLAPDANTQFIVGTHHVVRGYRGESARRECRWDVAEEVCSVYRKHLAGGLSYKSLELGGRLRRQALPRFSGVVRGLV
jgi:hypothetical protein